ncbi:uncharacterized protein LOC118730679 [Pipistrellus kuhlii]|uniref:uncharacterized protein LOC118730679 n=1 Tax=Pipistrellus kuhlii TaxID=59472 RepID=UPI001E273398|nr:uncharacterized protein LOC118730679 [Pipistrellus kuhlii]
MPEEVTYATLKFPNTSQSKKLLESCSLERTENHEMPELKLNNAAENGPTSIESTAVLPESRAVRGLPVGHSVPLKVWGPVVFILLMLNLAVLAGLGTLIIMNYQELFSSNRTVYDNDRQQNIITQLERNRILYMDMYKKFSSEHFALKNMVENTLKSLKNFTSKYDEVVKKKKNDLRFCSCSESCKWHGDSGKNFSSLICDIEKNGNTTQLFIRCLPSPVSWMHLNCTVPKKKERTEYESKFCILPVS